MITTGEYYNRNGSHYVMYEDVDEQTTDITKNIIKICDEYIEIRKRGQIDTNMIFQKGKVNKTYYSTPFGDMSVEINTNDIEINCTDKLLDVKIDYALLINNQHLSDCQVGMKIREAEFQS